MRETTGSAVTQSPLSPPVPLPSSASHLERYTCSLMAPLGFEGGQVHLLRVGVSDEPSRQPDHLEPHDHRVWAAATTPWGEAAMERRQRGKRCR